MDIETIKVICNTYAFSITVIVVGWVITKVLELMFRQ